MKSPPHRDWELTLVVLGDDELSAAARHNIEELCQKDLAGCRLTVLDAGKDPDLLKKFQIFAIPTLIRERPAPVKKIIGSLANRRILLQELGLKPRDPSPRS